MSILIIVTGGTLTSIEHVKGGLHPKSGLLTTCIKKHPEFNDKLLPKYDILEWEEAFDSSMFNTTQWIKLAEQIYDNYDKYKGFVIVHGTDTMAYTASAISFMLNNISKPIVFTGAILPLNKLLNDGKINLLASIKLAAEINIPEVCICFSNKITRGNRTTKIDSWSHNVYYSPNYPKLGVYGTTLFIKKKNVMKPPENIKLTICKKLFKNIIVLWLIPGNNEFVLETILMCKKEKAIILACFGSGNAPVNEKIIKMIDKNKITIVITSQCMRGSVNLDLYKTGMELQKLGVINSLDMTIEACVTKLSCLMGNGLRGDTLKREMEKDLRGELTENDERVLGSFDEKRFMIERF